MAEWAHGERGSRLLRRHGDGVRGSQFHVGDLAALDNTDSSLGGIVSRYSLIHMHPCRLNDVFREWMRVLEPEAPVLVSFFGSLSADAHGTAFDHAVSRAYEFFPATLARQLQHAGFVDIEIGIRNPPEGDRPLSQGTVLARKNLPQIPRAESH